jgi:UDP-perosamine 4-acetyltransferase
MSTWTEIKPDRPIIVLGAGGHARVLIDALQLINAEIIGITAPEHCNPNDPPYLGDDNAILTYAYSDILLVNGMGSLPGNNRRQEIFKQFHKLGYHFCSVIHPSATIASNVKIAEGVQIMAGAIIQPGVDIGQNSIINTGATIDHDCKIGEDVHIAPGSTLCGDITVGNRVHIGCGTTIIQNISIASDMQLAAGSLINNTWLRNHHG